MADVLSNEDLEAERLHYWHLFCFTSLGFARWQAELLEVAQADWRDAEDLLDQDCSHELALKILT